MGEFKAWIRTQREDGFGTLHLARAVALAQAGVREGLDRIDIITDQAGADLIQGDLPKGVKVEVWNEKLTPEQEAAKFVETVKPHLPKRVDASNPRPLVYLVGNSYNLVYQHMLWKAGAELTVVCDEGDKTYADWFVIAKPYGGELGVESGTGYSRYLRGAHYAPLRFSAMKAIAKHHDHKTVAQTFAIATENLDTATWLPFIGKALAGLEKPKRIESEWKPSLVLLPGPDCPSDDELKKQLGDVSLSVKVAGNRFEHAEELVKVDVLFSADNMTLQESMALGTVRVTLPRKGADEDLMFDHMVRREASPKVPDPGADGAMDEMQTVLTRVTFDASYRRGNMRIGQYLCDGLGSVRIMRQTAFKVYAVPQNMVRFFDVADPMIEQL